MILNFENSSFGQFNLNLHEWFECKGYNYKYMSKKGLNAVVGGKKKLNKYSGRFNFFFVILILFHKELKPKSLSCFGETEKCKWKTIVNAMNGLVLNLKIWPHFNGEKICNIFTLPLDPAVLCKWECYHSKPLRCDCAQNLPF